MRTFSKIALLILGIATLLLTACEKEELKAPQLESETPEVENLQEDVSVVDTSTLGEIFTPSVDANTKVESRSSDPMGIHGKSYYLRVRHSGKYVDGDINSNNIRQWSYTGSHAQVFKFYSAGDGSYFIQNYRSKKYLDITNGSTYNSANIQQYPLHRGNNQRFWVTFKDGYFQIRNKNSGRCLEVAGANTSNGANIQQYSCSGRSHQQLSFYTYRCTNRLVSVGSKTSSACHSTLPVIISGKYGGRTIISGRCSSTIELPYTSTLLYWQCGFGSNGRKSITNSQAFSHVRVCRQSNGVITFTFLQRRCL